MPRKSTNNQLELLPPPPPTGQVEYITSSPAGYRLQYEHPHGRIFQGNSIEWLESLEPQSIDLIFADPPYNIKKAEWDTFENQETYIQWSLNWIEPASRALKPHGSMFICGFSEILADLKHPAAKYFKGCRWLIWHYKNKANLGKDFGRSHESIIHFRKSKQFTLNIDDIRIPYGAHTLKYPARSQAETSNFGNGKDKHVWQPNPKGAKPKDVIELPTTCNGMGEKTSHPTQKPESLLRKLIMAASNIGDTVADPFSGSGTTLVTSEQLQRQWLGCDLSTEYNQWAIERIENITRKSINDWIQADQRITQRRESIR